MMRRSDENNNKTATILQKHRANTKSDEKRQNEKFVEKRNSKKGTNVPHLKHKRKKKWMIPSREEGWKKRLAFSSPTNALDRKTRRSTTTSSRTMGTSKR